MVRGDYYNKSNSTPPQPSQGARECYFHRIKTACIKADNYENTQILSFVAAKIRFIFITSKHFHNKVKEISSQPFADYEDSVCVYVLQIFIWTQD